MRLLIEVASAHATGLPDLRIKYDDLG